MIHGADPGHLDVFRERAKAAVVEHFVRQAEDDGTPPTLRAMYVLKAQQAEVVLAGGVSLNRLIEREAEARGYSSYEMAFIITWMAGESVELELARTSINVQLEAASSEADVIKTLADHGIVLANQSTGEDIAKTVVPVLNA